MKKLFFILVLAIAGASASAQSWQYNAGVSFGAYDRSGFSSEIVDIHRESETNGSRYESSPTILPTLSLEAGYIMEDAPVGFFLGAFWNYAWNNMKGGPSLLTEKEHILHILPEVRFYYFREGNLMMYSIMAGGIRYRQFSETFEGDRIANNSLGFSYQFSPFGMSYEMNKWMVHCEIGYGTAWAILKLGFGYQF